MLQKLQLFSLSENLEKYELKFYCSQQTGFYFETGHRKSPQPGRRCAAPHSSCTRSRPVFDKTSLVWLCEQNVCGGNGCQGEWGRQQMNPRETTHRWERRHDNSAPSSTSVLLSRALWRLVHSARRCVLGNLVGFLMAHTHAHIHARTHIHTLDNKLSIPSAYHACLLRALALAPLRSSGLVWGLNLRWTVSLYVSAVLARAGLFVSCC